QQHIELDAYLSERLEQAKNESSSFLRPDFSSIEAYKTSISLYRKMFFESIGYPPPGSKKNAEPRIKFVAEDAAAKIYRVWVEVMDGVDAYGIYMIPKNLKGKAPLLISQHGGGGCSETTVAIGPRAVYHEMGREAVKRGYIVWAPGLLARVTYGGDPVIEETSRSIIDQKARLLGTSLTAIQIFKIIQSTEALIKTRPEIDAGRVGMAGISMGGGYTLLTAAASPLIKVGVSAALFTDKEERFKRISFDDPEKRADMNVLRRFGNAQLVGLICPRPMMVAMGVNDPVIPIVGARKERPKAELFYQKLGIPDRFEFFEHSGGHEFHLESLFRFLDKHLK
ncbi:alpha/beta hydrolase family protein, partial [candidate division KSB1 bacterium]